jgi:hypothetical protein
LLAELCGQRLLIRDHPGVVDQHVEPAVLLAAAAEIEDSDVSSKGTMDGETRVRREGLEGGESGLAFGYVAARHGTRRWGRIVDRWRVSRRGGMYPMPVLAPGRELDGMMG